MSDTRAQPDARDHGTESPSLSPLSISALRFSQRSLADYQVCRRRFRLRYIDHLVWPAPFSQADAELEALMELGRDFHHAVHQKLIGVEPAEVITGNPDHRLTSWWEAFEAHALPGLPAGAHWPEAVLSVPLHDAWLVARLDLLVVSPSGDVTILDWKTGHPPDRGELERHMQTRVYPFVLAEAGHSYNRNLPVSPDRITMAYWYAQDPDRFVSFPYSHAAHERNRRELGALIGEILRLPADGFTQVENLAPCRRCNFRSYCGRRVQPAPAIELVDEEVDFLMETAAPYALETDL